MSIAGHVSRAMLSRYSRVRMEAKDRGVDEIAARQHEADEKRKAGTERQQADCGDFSIGGDLVILKPPPSRREWQASAGASLRGAHFR